MSYAEAINRALQERAQQLRDYGGFLAQAGIAIADIEAMPFEDWQQVHRGYIQQLVDYPNG